MRATTALTILLIFMTISLTVSATDGVAPLISDLIVDPSEGPVGTEYAITLRIRDPQGPEDIGRILFQIREKTEVIKVPIRDDGLEGDRSKGDGIYTGRVVVPTTAERRTHRFEVFVRDREGNESNTLEYRFIVLKGIEI